jgi:phosphatidate phosphatase APP1
MALKPTLARLIHPIEKFADRFSMPHSDAPLIQGYIGYDTPDYIVFRGRILTAERRNAPKPTQNRCMNFRQMLALFATDEVAEVRIAAGGVEALSDEEGYFTLLLPRPNGRELWWEVEAHLPDHPPVKAVLAAQITAPDAQFGIISDIDDTVLETGAYSLARNLWTSLTGNALTRHVFPDSVQLIRTLHADRNPVFFVSSSPWNMFQFLQSIFARFDLPRAPMFLRDLGLSETQFITGTHGDHKGASIDAILSANPTLPFVLVGDTGQHDAHVYLDAHRRHPGRIARVLLREPGPGPDDQSRIAIDTLRQEGVDVFSRLDFTQVKLP